LQPINSLTHNSQPARIIWAMLISVLLVAWNNKTHLQHCFSALSKQTLRDFEIILVDNASTDNSVAELHPLRSDLHLLVEQLSSNIGFAVANNIGAHLAQGERLAFLNVDAFPEPDWLEKLLKAAEENPEYSFFSSRQIQANAPAWLDGAGDAYHISGLAWRHGYNRPSVEFGHEPKEVFSACAAAALIRREEFLQMGGFDEDYFSYFEDVDLGFRLRLQGGKCLYVPAAIVHHVGSASTGKRSDFSVYYGYRNMIWTFIKNMPSPLFWILLPLHIVTVLFFIVYLTLRGQGKTIGRAVFDAIRGLPAVLEKRKKIQQARTVRWQDMLRVMSTGLFEPYLEFIRRNKSQ
jgi:GT2 family glycosyltransferase